MDSPIPDLRVAVRGLARRRSFTLVAVVTLALGIGATTTLFSLVDAVLLRPLPYPESARLFRVWQAFPEFREQETLRARWDRIGLSYPQYAALRDARAVVDHAAIFVLSTGDVTGIGHADKAWIASTSATLLPTLGLRPHLGRDFSPGDEEGEGGSVVLLSYDAWRRWYGGSPAVLGGLIKVDGRSCAIIGVMPPDLRLLGPPAMGAGSPVVPDVWTPIGRASRFAAAGQGHMYQTIVRLRSGVSAAAAQAAIVPLLRQVMATYRTTGRPPGASVEPLGRYETLGARSALWLLLAAAGIVLLVACGNVANLMLSEVVPRARELAVRATLGAGRARLVRLLLTESVVVAVLGGALGYGVAAWGVDGLVALAPPGTPNIDAVRLDARVFVFSLLLTAGSGLLFGLVPAWVAARADVVAGLKEVRPTMGRAGARAQHIVTVAQVALAVTVLACAALLAQSLVRLSRVDPGFRTEGLLTFGIELPRARYPEPEQRRRFFDDLRGRLASLPGVLAVTQTTSLPFRPASITSNPISVAGGPASHRSLEAERRLVVPNFFGVVGLSILEGEGLSEGDGACQVLVSRATVSRLWPNGGAIGARMVSMDEPCTVVGIVSDVKERGLGADPLPTFYRVSRQGDGGRAAVIVRTDPAPESLIPAVRSLVASLDSELPVLDPASMQALIRRTLVADRYRTIPLALFAVATVLLAGVGTYGVMAQLVSRQTRAIGIRVALGAGPSHAMGFVLRHAAVVGVAGVAVGLAGAVAASRVIRTFLFGVGPTDVLTYTAVAVGVFVLTLLAGWIPAHRATRLEPARVLRTE